MSNLPLLLLLLLQLIPPQHAHPPAAAPDLVDVRIAPPPPRSTRVYAHAHRNDADAHQACVCIQTVLSGYFCPTYIRYTTRVCRSYAPRFYQTVGCLSLCCAACETYGRHWPVCHHAHVQQLCFALATHVVPMQQLDPKPTMMLEPTTTPIMTPTPAPFDLDDAPPQPSPDDLDASPDPSPQLSVFEQDGPVMPGELDDSPALGRPFAPAACECMLAGRLCTQTMAASSGVCRARRSARSQPDDCVFACCRICTVNMDVSYCMVPRIERICAARFP